MKVLHVIPSISPVHGGPSRAIVLIDRALNQLGISIDIATTDDDGPGRRLSSEKLIGRYGSDSKRSDAVLACHIFRKQTEFYKVSMPLYFWLKRHIEEYDIVHIHAMFSFSSICAARVCKSSHVPYIIRPLGTLTSYGVTRRRPFLKRLSLRFLEGPALRNAAAVHFTADTEATDAKAWGHSFLSAVIPLAVEQEAVVDVDELYRLFPSLKGTPYLLFLSRIDVKKNLESLLDAMALLKGSFSELRLVVAGRGDPHYEASLRERAQSLGVDQNVIWTGFVSGSIKASIFSEAALFVLPSFSENFGIAAVEALQAGVPCVLGRDVGIAAQIQSAGAGLAVEPTAVCIADAIQHILTRSETLASHRLAAKRLASAEFGLSKMGAGLRELYETVIAEHASKGVRRTVRSDVL